MRHEFYRMAEAEALAFLAEAPVVHLATVGREGQPILRTVHGVLVDGAIAFHGAPAGEKLEAIGQPAVIGAEETIAEIPSYFLDPQRACPATTYYRSVQLHGTIEQVEEPAAKARVLQALMVKLQPDGGYVPITADDPLYAKAVAGILVMRVSPGRIDGKGKLGQNRKPEELSSVLRQLWRRGRDRDLRAIDVVRQANPEVALPAPLTAGPGWYPVLALTESDWPEAAALLAGYGQSDRRPAGLRAHLTGGWVGMRNDAGELIATGRVASDGESTAWIRDLAVVSGPQRGPLTVALIALLLDHPLARDGQRVVLEAGDAAPLPPGLGFREVAPGQWVHLRQEAARV